VDKAEIDNKESKNEISGDLNSEESIDIELDPTPDGNPIKFEDEDNADQGSLF
jgi:hypothetical protein